MKKKLNPFSALIHSRAIAKMLGFPWLKLAVGIMLSGVKNSMRMARMAIGFKAFQVGTFDGDNDRGVLPIGQVTGIIHDTPTVDQIIRRMMAEAKKARTRIDGIIK
jgi:NAD(P)H-dependent flavin oxidoreductase YrpB (nitropropane dioxygenase family)